jgi:hypothetical protein
MHKILLLILIAFICLYGCTQNNLFHENKIWEQPGTYTYSLPDGMKKVSFILVGGGGGGCDGGTVPDPSHSSAAGGNGGNSGEIIYIDGLVLLDTTLTISVGSGGASNNKGGDTSISGNSFTITAHGGGIDTSQQGQFKGGAGGPGVTNTNGNSGSPGQGGGNYSLNGKMFVSSPPARNGGPGGIGNSWSGGGGGGGGASGCYGYYGAGGSGGGSNGAGGTAQGGEGGAGYSDGSSTILAAGGNGAGRQGSGGAGQPGYRGICIVWFEML